MTAEATVIPYNTFARVLLRFVILAVVVKLVETQSSRAADILVILILGSVVLTNRETVERFTRFLRFEIGG